MERGRSTFDPATEWHKNAAASEIAGESVAGPLAGLAVFLIYDWVSANVASARKAAVLSFLPTHFAVRSRPPFAKHPPWPPSLSYTARHSRQHLKSSAKARPLESSRKLQASDSRQEERQRRPLPAHSESGASGHSPNLRLSLAEESS